MRSLRKRGFGLLELAVVLVIVAVILAIGIPYLSRMRANNAINAASERLAGEITQAQGKAKGFGVPLPDTILGTLPAAQPFPQTGTASVRVRQRRTPADPLQTIAFFQIGDLDQIPVEVTNLSRLVFEDQASLVGTVLELGTGKAESEFQIRATLPIDANGTIALPDPDQLGALLVGRNPDHAWVIEVGQLGKVKRRKF